MIFVDKFRIFILVVGLCGTLIQPSQAQGKCAKADKVEDCAADGSTPQCGVDGKTGAPTGCVAASVCPATATAELSCEAEKCCCTAAAEACQDLMNNKAQKDAACKIAPIKDIAGFCDGDTGGGTKLKCHGDKDIEIECKEKENCGVHSDGTNFGCYDSSVCLAAPTATLACDTSDLTKHCCCFGEKCNSHAAACLEETLKGKLTDCGGASPSPPTGGPTPAPTGEPGDSGSERSAVTLSVGSLVAIASVGGLSHRISSGA